MAAGKNKLQGSSVPEFANWTSLTVFSIFENPGLGFDLGILQNMSELQEVLVHVCAMPQPEEDMY